MEIRKSRLGLLLGLLAITLLATVYVQYRPCGHSSAPSDVQRHLLLFDPKTVEGKDQQVSTVQTASLITSYRFDLMSKLIYAESYLSNNGQVTPWARYVYVEHERTLNGLHEECHESQACRPKDGEEAFQTAFNRDIDSLRAEGFQSPPYPPIKITEHKCFENGAHRIAAWYALSRDLIPVEIIPGKKDCDENYSHDWFAKKGLNADILDGGLLRYLRLMANGEKGGSSRYVHGAILWPSTNGQRYSEVLAILKSIGTVIAERTISFKTKEAADLFVQHLYPTERWVKYGRSRSKTKMCFTHQAPVRVFFVETTHELEVVTATKSKIRELFGLGKDSIHISDTTAQTLEIGMIVLNKNSVQNLVQMPWSSPEQRYAAPCTPPNNDDERQRYYLDSQPCVLDKPNSKNKNPAKMSKQK